MKLTHGSLKNEGTENLHSLENIIFDRALCKGEKNENMICQKMLFLIFGNLLF